MLPVGLETTLNIDLKGNATTRNGYRQAIAFIQFLILSNRTWIAICIYFGMLYIFIHIYSGLSSKTFGLEQHLNWMIGMDDGSLGTLPYIMASDSIISYLLIVWKVIATKMAYKYPHRSKEFHKALTKWSIDGYIMPRTLYFISQSFILRCCIYSWIIWLDFS